MFNKCWEKKWQYVNKSVRYIFFNFTEKIFFCFLSKFFFFLLMLKLISSSNDEKPGVCMRFFILASSLMTFPTFMYWQVSRRPVGFASNKWTSRELQLKASKVADNSAQITWRPLQYLSYDLFSLNCFIIFKCKETNKCKWFFLSQGVWRYQRCE